MKPSWMHASKNLQRGWTFVSISLVLLLILSACQPQQVTPVPKVATPTPLPPVPVENLYPNPWVLVAYGDPANPTVLPRDVLITAVFSADGTLSGQSACNSYSTGFTANPDGSMTIEPEIATTQMACPEDIAAAEKAYLQALTGAQTFSFTPAGQLAINYLTPDSKNATLVYAVGQVPLTGTTWSLLSFGSQDNPQPVPAGVTITAVFGTDGTLSGSAGCNNYSTIYTAEDGVITIQPISTTFMACPSGMEQEQAYLSLLGTATTYQVIGKNLTIYSADGQTLNYTSATLPLEATLWTLAAVNGQPIPTNIAITMLLLPGSEAGKGTVSGQAGCNQYNGAYTESESTLTFSELATTRMMCDEIVMQAEQTYLQALSLPQNALVLGASLTLTSAEGVLSFAAARTPLTSALWVLTALGDINNPQSPVAGSNFTAQFTRSSDAPTGVVAGTTGCNEYASVYTSSLTEIKINLPATTGNKTCVPGLQDQEQIYTLALNDARQYRILGNTLVIPYDDGKQALIYQATQIGLTGNQPLSNLNNSQWFLWTINDQPVINGATISANFVVNPDGRSGTLNGSAGCNLYQATFGEALGVQTSLNSNQSCAKPTGIMEQEVNYLAALGRAYGYWLTGDQLILNTGQGALVYRLTPPPQSSDQAYLLQDANWYLVSYNTTLSFPGAQGDANLRFNSNGTLSGYTGCNNLQGQYSTDLNKIAISGLSQTLAACPNSVLAAQEKAMLDILNSAQTYQVFDTAMQLVGSMGVLNFYFAPVNDPTDIKPPSAVITAPAQATVGEVVTFSAAKSTAQVPITNYQWDFGDGGRGTGVQVNHVYAVPGVYRVQMTVTDQRGARSSAAWEITIQPIAVPTPLPTAAPTAIPTTPPQPTATPPLLPTMPSKPTVPSLPTLEPTPTPESTEIPRPTLEPTKPPPPTPEPTQPPEPTPEPTLPPQPVPPQAVIQGPGSGYPGEPVTFDASASQPGSSPIASYQWNFGDGTSLGPNPAASSATTIFNRAGAFEVAVVVTDQNGISSSASMQVVINARLDTTVWSLSQLNGQNLIPGTAITLQFLNGTLAGFAGCNTYTGAYTAVDNGDGTYSVTGANLQVTQMMCPGEIMAQEQLYISLLTSVQTAQISGNGLLLNSPGGTLKYSQIGSATPF